MSHGCINNLVNAGQWEGVLRASLIEVFEIDTKAPGLILLRHHDQVGYLVRVLDFSNEPGLE